MTEHDARKLARDIFLEVGAHVDGAALVRASLAAYNRREDLDALVRGLGRVRELFR